MTDQTPSTEDVRNPMSSWLDLIIDQQTPPWDPPNPERIAAIRVEWEADLAARDREVAAKALSSLSAEFTRMSLELQESDRYAEDYWRGSAQALIAAAQLAEDHATSIGAGDE